ncbi:MAG: hypothetical protein U1E52_21460 [Geminicoccaceae bacterium]
MGWSKLHCSLFAASLALGAGAIAPAWSATGHDSVGMTSISSIGGIVLAKHGADDPPGDDRGGRRGKGGKGRGGHDDGPQHTSLTAPGSSPLVMAKNGADDPPGDDRGGRRGKGGKGRGGHDDGPHHT